MTKYVETDGTDDLESRVLDAVAGDMPYVMVIVQDMGIGPNGGPEFDLRCVVGGGIDSAESTKSLLRKALGAFPE